MHQVARLICSVSLSVSSRCKRLRLMVSGLGTLLVAPAVRELRIRVTHADGSSGTLSALSELSVFE